MSEYLEHLAQDDAMVSSTLSSVLRQQTRLDHEPAGSLACKIICDDIEITTGDIQDVSFSENDTSVSFFAGLGTVGQAQGLYGSLCKITCGTIEVDNAKCIHLTMSKISPATFVVSLKFQNAL